MGSTENYRKLVRNLRLGNHLKLKMTQPPVELEAVAALLREEGVRCELRQPGSHELPLTKAPLWRIQCHVGGMEFAVSIIGQQASVVRIVEYPQDPGDVRDGKRPMLGYEGTIGDFSTTPYTAKRKSVDLADPESPQKLKQVMLQW